MMALLLFMTACAAPVRSPEGDEIWQGRLALQIDGEPPQAYAGGFELRGSALQGELRLSTPLGQALAEVRWDASGAELRRGQQLTRRGNLDELTHDLAGTALPVAAMFDWLHGRDTRVDGWEADLSRHAEGRIMARRSQPAPAAQLRLVFLP